MGFNLTRKGEEGKEKRRGAPGGAATIRIEVDAGAAAAAAVYLEP